MKYSVDDLVRVAKREHNSIRPYLYVNPLQGKHIPTNPGKTMDMCYELAGMVNGAYPNDRLYVIGFAETATGIAAAVSHYLKNILYYQNTTRECKKDEEYLYFTESHSHAVDQMLRSSGIQECLHQVDRIILIDDEVTTGNTICKLVDAIKKSYATTNVQYSIVSLLNSIGKDRMEQLKNEGIECLFLSELPFEYKKESIMHILYDSDLDTRAHFELKPNLETIAFNTQVNVRRIEKFAKYDAENERFIKTIMGSMGGFHCKELLVLGTEECIYPAIRLGDMLRISGMAEEVSVHATTRSPIIASGEDGYPLYHRYQIRSLYNPDRNTFIYNLRRYDIVIIVTDSTLGAKGASDLVGALQSVGNRKIIFTQWN